MPGSEPEPEVELDVEEGLTFELVAEAVGARRSLIVRLARQGLLNTLAGDRPEPLLERRTVLRLRRMQRLRRDLGVNFAGAAVILDLVERMDRMKRELTDLHRHLGI